MDKNKLVSLYNCHSVKSLYKGTREADLSLEIYEYGADAVELRLINKKYIRQHKLLKTQRIYLNICFIGYTILILVKDLHVVTIDIVLILWLIVLLWRLSQLVKSENIIFCHDFGILLQAQKYWGEHNRFIAASNIHDIVINEVLEDVDFRYLLIIRTKGVLFHKKPIVCIFEIFKPSFDCLSIIYKHLNSVAVRETIA